MKERTNGEHGLSTRATNVLDNAGILKATEAQTKTALLKVIESGFRIRSYRNCGSDTVRELYGWLGLDAEPEDTAPKAADTPNSRYHAVLRALYRLEKEPDATLRKALREKIRLIETILKGRTIRETVNKPSGKT